MPSGQNTGDSTSVLTVDSAAPAIERILFPEEDKGQPTATPETEPEQSTPEAAAPDVEEPEATEDTEDAPASDDESEDESETDDVADETPAQPAKVKVKVDGQDLEVTLDEALQGYSRTQDYTRKTQKLSEEKKAFEAEQNAIRAERQQIQAKLTTLESQYAAVQEPDWDKLLNEDPNAYPIVYATWQRHKDALAKVQQERLALEQRMQADAAQQFSAHVASEAQKLTAAVPEWKDAELAKKEKAAMLDFAHSLGWTDDVLGQITDHRAMLVLRKAMLFDAAEKAKAEAALKAKPKIEKVKTATPGPASSTKREVSELTRRKQRLSKTGSVDDAASLIELMLPNL